MQGYASNIILKHADTVQHAQLLQHEVAMYAEVHSPQPCPYFVQLLGTSSRIEPSIFVLALEMCPETLQELLYREISCSRGATRSRRVARLTQQVRCRHYYM